MKITLILYVSFALLLVGCASQNQIVAGTGEEHVTVESMEADTVWSHVDSGALLIDVRSPAEFESGHIEGALNIPHDQIRDRIAEIGQNKDREIIVYCRSGRRAGIAADSLASHGYTKIFNAGGYSDLMQSRNKN